jgi:CrcB protein
MSPLIVAAALVAGAAGAAARYGTTRAVEARWGRENLPRAVLIVNVAGSLIAGAVIGAVQGGDPELTYVLVSGFTAGLTTFSTWSVETIQLALAGRMRAAVRNVVVNLLAGGAAVVAGWFVAGLISG